MEDQVSISFDAGILLCSHIRDFLESCQFDGMKIQFREGKGWLSRTFQIKGDREDIIRIQKALDNWKRENNL